MLNSILKEDIPVATEKLINLENGMLAVSSQLKEIDYRKIFATLEESVNNMKSITEALNSEEGTAGLLLKDSTLYNNLNDASKAATALLDDLKKNPKRYVHFSLFGRKEKNQEN
jgi:phospholipid/cholesterol/gamma-HCH transport system substrate-binding protein